MWQQERGTPAHSSPARLSSADCLQNNPLESELSPLSFPIVVFNRRVFFLANLPPFTPDSCRCENVKWAQSELGWSFPQGGVLSCFVCTVQFQRDYTHREGHPRAGGYPRMDGCGPGVLASALECSPELGATGSCPCPQRCPRAEPGDRDGGEDWECPSLVTIPDEQLLVPVTEQQHRDNSVGPELLLLSFGFLDS